ncbi:MAG TPA: amidohydrolase family protein [Parvularculaceae bacterium]|nr:amidohydrolase family protein [Parvularculaceae bacterium]
MRSLVLVAAAAFFSLSPADAKTIALAHVTAIDVEDGTRRDDQTLIIKDGKIVKIGPSAAVAPPAGSEIVDGSGKFLIPGLWDMHVHSHREERWKYHYPLFLAHGVLGVRDAGSHLGSALAAMEWTKRNPIAPHIVWGSPIIDGAPQINSFGLSAEDAPSARILVREMKRYGFDFVKSYDRLTPEAYFALADEARKQKIPLEGHVPLSLTPKDAIAAGQTVIDHLTLVVEACSPPALALIREEYAKAPREAESLGLLMNATIVDAFADIDMAACRPLFEEFAAHGVWQVPTLVQMRGFFHADDPEVSSDARIAFAPPAIAAEWKEWSETADRRELAIGKKAFAAQLAAMRAMQDAGVGILAGTDASNEAYVFAGAGVHDELTLMVDAGLTPLEALQTATINPLLYLGRTSSAPVISKGEPADLILLDADPLEDIANTTSISGVFAHGDYLDRSALDALLETAKAEAAKKED